MILDRLAKNANVVARVERGDDNTVASFVDEGCGKALIASATSSTEWIETDSVHSLDALFQAAFDADEVFLQIRSEFLECIGTADQINDGIADRCSVLVRQEFFELHIQINNVSSQGKYDSRENYQ